ncbi:hypothetical protein ABZ897_42935 [Nonomuraea sp. NPDC046802]|uniref:hypothetical protein n=1 Tax=Nonomuraea sp. NPDC046802 TaxID=3154919 RepID=UPI0033D5EF18
MSELSETERAQFAGVMQAIRAGGAHLENSRAVGRELADFLRRVLPGIDDVTIGRVLHKAAMEIATRRDTATTDEIIGAFTLAAFDLAAPALGDEGRSRGRNSSW